MLKAGHILDLYDDAEGVHLKDGEVLKKYGNLQIDRAQDLRHLPDKDFALVVFMKTGEQSRKYPMHTPDALALSTHYFEKVGAELPRDVRMIVASNLALGYHRFGAEVPGEISKLASERVEGNQWEEGCESIEIEEAPAEPRAAEKYALRHEMVDGSVVEMFPLDTAEDALASADELSKIAGELPPRDRYEAATAIGEALRDFGRSDARMSKLASLDPNPAFMTHIAARMEILKDDQSKKTLDTLSKLAGELPGAKLAQALEIFDKKAGISFHWDKRIRNPWDSCFQAKTAGEKVGDRVVTAEALVGLIDSGKLASIFKKSTLRDFREQPLEVFRSLPDPLKNEITALL